MTNTMPAAEYYADKSDSYSSLEDFRYSVRYYRAKYITKTLPKEEVTEALHFGTAFDTLLLTPADFEKTVLVKPEWDARSNAGKAIRDQFLAESKGKTWLSEKNIDIIKAMVEATKENRAVIELLAEGVPQYTLKHDKFGIPYKCRMDWVKDTDNIIVDVKTTDDASPDAFARSVVNYGYHRQAASYSANLLMHKHGIPLEAITGETLPRKIRFIFIACSKQPPHDCFTYELEDSGINLGFLQFKETLATLIECRRTDMWIPLMYHRINFIPLPRWAYGGIALPKD
jgi:hypothetical protein